MSDGETRIWSIGFSFGCHLHSSTDLVYPLSQMDIRPCLAQKINWIKIEYISEEMLHDPSPTIANPSSSFSWTVAGASSHSFLLVLRGPPQFPGRYFLVLVQLRDPRATRPIGKAPPANSWPYSHFLAWSRCGFTPLFESEGGVLVCWGLVVGRGRRSNDVSLR